MSPLPVAGHLAALLVVSADGQCFRLSIKQRAPWLPWEQGADENGDASKTVSFSVLLHEGISTAILFVYLALVESDII